VEADGVTVGTVLYLHGFVGHPAIASSLAGIRQLSGVCLVEIDDMACAVSAVAAGDYERPPDGHDQAAQLEWLTPRVRRHHDVLRALHAAGTVVPFKFGALCPGVEEVRALLHEYHDPVADMLARFDGKDEWALKAATEADAVSSFVERRHPQLIALKQEHERLPEGRAHFARKRLEKATTALIAEQLEIVEESVVARLSRSGVEISGSLSHAALLVERRRFTELEKSLADLEEQYAALRLTVELTGPWPPYSFATDLVAARS
jgi:hypothetical protein